MVAGLRIILAGFSESRQFPQNLAGFSTILAEFNQESGGIIS